VADVLTDADPGASRAAAAALLRIVAGHAAAVARLREELEHGDAEGRVGALQALWVAGESAAPLLDPVVGLLEFHDERVRDTAARTLGAMGWRAEPALPALRAALGRAGGSSFRLERAIEAIETAMRR
jgi:HEAT repeat protein